MRRLAALALLLLLWPLRAGADVSVDWAGGRLLARVAAAADLRAPSPEIARVAAERTARARGRAELLLAARALPWAGGATLGARADADAAVKRQIDAALDGAATDEVRTQSDGSIVLRVSASLDALAGQAPASAVPAIILDGRQLGVRPALGYTLVGGKEKRGLRPSAPKDGPVYAGPLRFAASAPRAPDGTIADVDGAELGVPAAALAHATAPVLILTGDSQ